MLHAQELLIAANVFSGVKRIGLILVAAFAAGCNVGLLLGTGTVDMDGEWRLQSGTLDGDPIPLVADAPITLRIDGTEAGGTSACNRYGGTLRADGGRVRFSDLHGTLIGCEGDVGASEAAYLQALSAVTHVDRIGVTLVLTGDGNGMELRFIDTAAEGG